MRVLGVIPARGGSKGVPRKNLRNVGGKPLVAWSVEVALEAADVLYRTVVSTDDAEIAEVCRGRGADVPFLRPPELGGDRAPMVPVLRHAAMAVEEEEGRPVDWVMLLQPTNPFRTADDIREAVRLASRGGCDSVISVVRVLHVHPILMKRIEGDRLLPYCVEEKEGTRRQDYDPPAYMRNGAIYLTGRGTLLERDSIWGDAIRPYVMPAERSVGIDSELDLKLADLVMRERIAAAGAAGAVGRHGSSGGAPHGGA